MVMTYDKMVRMKTWGKAIWALTLAAISLSMGAWAQESADDLLASMRKMMVSQGSKDVLGSIRKGSMKVPFSLSARGNTIAFQYKQGDAWKRFDVRIGDRKADLMLVSGGKAVVMSPSSYAQPIAGTDVTYEDLSLRFLYWKGGVILPDSADSRVKGRDCYIVQAANPSPG